MKEKVPPFYLVKLGKLQEEFQSEAANFSHMMMKGGGIHNVHMLDTLRELNILYLRIAAVFDAHREINNGNGSLDDGIEALSYIRELEKRKEESSEQAS